MPQGVGVHACLSRLPGGVLEQGVEPQIQSVRVQLGSGVMADVLDQEVRMSNMGDPHRSPYLGRRCEKLELVMRTMGLVMRIMRAS